MISTLVTALALASQDPAPSEGLWAGGYQNGTEFVSLEIRIEEGEQEGLLSMPERGVRFQVALERDGDRIAWAAHDDNGARLAHFEGHVDGATMSGKVELRTVAAQLECGLVRVVEQTPEERSAFVGTYRLDEETSLRIVEVPRVQDAALGIEFPAEDMRALLFPVGTGEFVAGEGEAPLPIAVRLQFTLDGAGSVELLELALGDARLIAHRENDESALPELPRFEVAPDLGVERREVRIAAGDVELAATLYFPPGVERPCPAVVQLHGSAPTVGSSQWFFFTSDCLRSGLAVLAFDKRGCGGSGGEFRSFTVAGSAKLFDQLASDAAAAHAWLREQEGIDPERVGLVGGSQAGWIMPLVAEKTPGVRFILSGCGPTVSAGEENYHADLLQRGRSLADADRLLAEFEGPHGYDPRPVLRRVETPMLWLFGERDDVIPTRACLEELARLRAEGHHQHHGHLFADTDHNFRISSGEGVLLEPVFTAWLRAQGVLD